MTVFLRVFTDIPFLNTPKYLKNSEKSYQI